MTKHKKIPLPSDADEPKTATLIERVVRNYDLVKFASPPIPENLVPPPSARRRYRRADEEVVEAEVIEPAVEPVPAGYVAPSLIEGEIVSPRPARPPAAKVPATILKPVQFNGEHHPINRQHLREQGLIVPESTVTAVLEEFRILWGSVDGALKLVDIRRIGMVAEYRYSVDNKNSSVWLRSKLTTVPTKAATDKFTMRFEEREFAKDGGIPDPKKADFLNCIYTIYDSFSDANHPLAGFVDVDVDAQRYFTPLLNGNVPDEVLKLHKHFESAQKKIDEYLMSLGATHGKR